MVTHCAGILGPNTQEFTEENTNIVESKGGIVLTTTHTFNGLSRTMRKHFNTYIIGEIVAKTMRILGKGVEVICEIVPMAADSGLVRTDEDIIAISGTKGGADTAIVLRPAYSSDFFDLRVKEILCKPYHH